MKFCQEILEAICYHMVKTEVSILPRLATVLGRYRHQDTINTKHQDTKTPSQNHSRA